VRHRATSGGHKGDDGAGGKAADTSSPAPLPDAEVGRAAQVG
jgi:hypothetical protein